MTTELIVAVDVDSLDKALRLRDELSDVVDLFKVGKELFTAVGPRILDELTASRVFLDLKFHDIPNTVAGAVTVAASAGVAIVDVHASGGRAMMEAASAAARKSAANMAGMSGPRVFGVTVLTHLADDDLREVGIVSSSEPIKDTSVLSCSVTATPNAPKSMLAGIRNSWHVEMRLAFIAS